MRLLELRTVQSTAIKTLSEALKDMLTDTKIEFDLSGMKITAMDNAHIVLVHLKLEANRFEHYQCAQSRLSIGLNMLNFHKLLKTINNNDILMLFIESDDPNHLGIRIENNEKNSCTTYRLDLLDLDNQVYDIDSAGFPSVLTLPSGDFQKICRDMHNIADHVEIKYFNNKLVFSCRGEFCSQETVLATDDKKSEDNEIIQGVFQLKYLVMFAKCTNLCSTVELYLKNNYALIVKYEVANLGCLKAALAPHLGG